MKKNTSLKLIVDFSFSDYNKSIMAMIFDFKGVNFADQYQNEIRIMFDDIEEANKLAKCLTDVAKIKPTVCPELAMITFRLEKVVLQLFLGKYVGLKIR